MLSCAWGSASLHRLGRAATAAATATATAADAAAAAAVVAVPRRSSRRRHSPPTLNTTVFPAAEAASSVVSPIQPRTFHSCPLPGLPPRDASTPKTKQAKVKKKAKRSDTADAAAAAAAASSQEKGGRDALIQHLARAHDAVAVGPPRASKEEMARRAKIGNAYVKGMFEWHNELNHDLACKIRLKKHAIEMLPREGNWKKAALVIDDDDAPPFRRDMPTDFPPIPGFDPTPFLKLEEDR